VLKQWISHVVVPALGPKRRAGGPMLEVRVARRSRESRTWDRKKVRTFGPRLKVVFRSAEGLRSLTPLATVIECGFDDQGSQGQLSSKYGLSRRSVVRARVSMSCAYLMLQELMLTRMLEAFRHAPPACIVKHIAWDETGERFSVTRPDAGLGGSRWTQRYEIMVCRMKLLWGWVGASRPMSLEVVIPPLAVNSGKASTLYYAIWQHRLVARCHHIVRQMMDLTERPLCLYEAVPPCRQNAAAVRRIYSLTFGFRVGLGVFLFPFASQCCFAAYSVLSQFPF
jgi:hypothetical protein